MMNQLEESLCKSVREAFKDCENTTQDWWLFDMPEHYLQNAIYVHMSDEHELYLEASLRKIIQGEGRPRLGRPSKDPGKRYDLIVWHKASQTMRAVIEVKRSWSMTAALRRDAKRIKKETKAATGYLVAYTEMKAKRGVQALTTRFEAWAKELDLRWLNKDAAVLGEYEDWIAAFALFRRKD